MTIKADAALGYNQGLRSEKKHQLSNYRLAYTVGPTQLFNSAILVMRFQSLPLHLGTVFPVAQYRLSLSNVMDSLPALSSSVSA